mmetsp:Transcript_59122/g.129510  ORF Transcript_59122/g.129510 Transcript_59122/m.129510 type:complete len:145 (+) Transcript_59122:51-485(+)|eukprot:CAMPEP_0204269786 /NCGR_PEP_ID=MMETSP0468-20130131/17212_1 /ASSEMBLY_ACC=CAM_ASM_000383 /TAXON_ID=2969 /ORGANISM="Oxyrrhis marina" /LENGTH=144 /DNA_ID=CAMNT_0051245223 /DNA_START=46 /DNA_END=480 /DNA_ORIENTATION=+
MRVFHFLFLTALASWGGFLKRLDTIIQPAFQDQPRPSGFWVANDTAANFVVPMPTAARDESVSFPGSSVSEMIRTQMISNRLEAAERRAQAVETEQILQNMQVDAARKAKQLRRTFDSFAQAVHDASQAMRDMPCAFSPRGCET